ncbi:GH25 family lysozyme [Amycolatopsis australiensis]|uniref:Lysozyme n=1 Tax=Amycolatopsis australiensis TaxID=546364 RepID=A0A1K1SAH9_9PSEU|nr:GH25 family lysozyme [Amycolatopsis australiensis]SFW81310.1 Lyzozyme M1 (1,4-beta-N-acetylmuramidase), GH25 family [Amycolatopsis australiensis]
MSRTVAGHDERRWRRRAATAAALAALATAAVATPAGAASPDYSLAATNYAGTQIALHEGVQGTARAEAGQTLGHDVSGHQGVVDWPAAAGAGAKFTYVKATEGTGFVNPQFAGQYDGAHAAGIIRGAYHFARPDVSGGAEQAEYFIANGGGWRADGTTLPGALDIEYNPYGGDVCYGKSPADMTAWIADFTRTYLAKVKRSALIYTSTSWWKRCTGNTGRFGDTDPLWLARYAPDIGELPAGWDKQSIWQFARDGGLPGDQNYYNGPLSRVQALAKG